MRILVLTSRYTATRDIIDEDFGRQTRLFAAFKKFNHDIDFFCADYRKFEDKKKLLHGINVNIKPFGIFHIFSFLNSLNNQIKNKNYDYIISTSDPLWGIIGYIFAKRHKVKFVYDLHDNYETYSTYKLPFFKFIDNYVIKNADIVTTVSYSLKNKVKTIRKQNVFVMQNGVDTNLFKPMEKPKCRKELKLPENAKIVAYAGSIQRLQGIDLLIAAVQDLRKEMKNLVLAIAGRFYGNEHKYIDLNKEGIIYLGSLTQDKVVKLVNAADVVVVPSPANDFTNYCFPYKVVEYMACNTPIVATDVGDVGILLKNFKGSLCEENNKKDMLDKIKIQLSKKKINYRAKLKNSWHNIAKELDRILRK